MYKLLVKPIFFLFAPETIHKIVFFKLRVFSFIPGFGSLTRALFSYKDTSLEREVFGLKFPNPVGLAAGFDKDGKIFNQLSDLGFGFVEVGTVTPVGQPGNPKPRLFRLPKDEALINRMGFNNKGVEALVKQLKKKRRNIIIGGNIGKNKLTPNEEAVGDYEQCFEELHPWVDYFVVNVSSPNTPGLRELQEKKPLTLLLKRLQELNSKKKIRRPILLKIAPDLSVEQLNDIIDIVKEIKLDGLVATNTTIDRDNLTTSDSALSKIGNGGLSGKPLSDRSTEVIRYIHEKSNGSIPIIGVGGIHDGVNAKEKLDAGACLIQIYTGFIYEGPSIIRRINKYLLKSVESTDE